MIAESCEGLVIGKIDGEDVKVTVREVCNKIIHAMDVTLSWTDINHENEIEFWNGVVWIEGSKGKKTWKLELRVSEFCTALYRFLTELEESVDWAHLYKYDS